METNLLDRMLGTYLAGQTVVTVTLQNKIRVSGKIKAFDSYVIVMEGQKREILYRHAVSSIAPNVTIEQRRRSVAAKPAAMRVASFKSGKPSSQKAKAAHAQLFSPAGETQNLNNTMKDGLLKWMQEQKAAK
jgi:RNA chaperone Hfq